MTSELQHGARLSVISRLLGQVLLLQAAFTLAPIAVCLYSGDTQMGWTLVRGAILATVVGATLQKLTKPSHVQKNEVLCVAGLSFLMSALISSQAFAASGLSYVDAFFEAVSAVTTTGLSTVSEAHERSAGFLFLRAWIQWYGGLGMVAFAVALSLNPALLANRIASGGATARDAIGGTRPHYRRIILVYLSITLLGVLLVAGCGASWFNAIALTFSAISTGGFSPVEGSLAKLPRLAASACLVISLAASLPLVYYHLGVRNRWKSIANEPQWKMLLIVASTVTVLLLLVMLASGTPWSQSLWQSATMAVSAQSSAGFSTMNPATIPDSGKIAMIVAMFFGGAAGSTAGGTKLLRWIIVTKTIGSMIRRSLTPPHTVTRSQLGDSLIESEELTEAITIITLFAGTVFAAWFAFTWVGHDPLNSLFEVVSATATVGLSAGICGPDLETSNKLFLSAAMLMGRVEIVAWLVILWPPTWTAPRRHWNVHSKDPITDLEIKQTKPPLELETKP